MNGRQTTSALVAALLVIGGLALYSLRTPGTSSTVTVNGESVRTITTTTVVNQTVKVITNYLTTVIIAKDQAGIILANGTQLVECADTSYFQPDTVAYTKSTATYVSGNSTSTSTFYIAGPAPTTTVGSSTIIFTTSSLAGGSPNPGHIFSTTSDDPNAEPSGSWTAMTCTYLPE